MIYDFKEKRPVVHESSFVHPLASLIGDVVIGKNVYIGSGASIRGDFGKIIIEDGCNVQENCIIHMFPGVTVVLKENAHIGHAAIIHGAQVGRNVMVGMNSVLMDNVEVGDHSIIGAMTLVPTGMVIPERKVAVGNPAKIIKDVTEEMLEWKTKGTKLYQELAGECLNSLLVCDPMDVELMKNPDHENKKGPEIKQGLGEGYKIWKETRKG